MPLLGLMAQLLVGWKLLAGEFLGQHGQNFVNTCIPGLVAISIAPLLVV
jgi:hypothetical protein